MMNRFTLTLLLVLGCTLGLKAQFVTFEDFEGDEFPPHGWTVHNGGDDSTFIHLERGVHTGTGCACIWYTDFAHDDYLVTPKLAISNGNSTLTGWFLNHSSAYPEVYDVMVSTTGTDPADFELFLAEPNPGQNYIEKTYDLSSFIEQEIYVAFKSSTTFAHALYIDDINLPPIVFDSEHDLSITDITPSSIPHGDFIPKVMVTNYGNDGETNYTVTLTDGGLYNETITMTDNLSSSQKLAIEFPVYSSLGQGTYSLTATVTVAEDENTANNSYSKEVYIYDPIYVQSDFITGPGEHVSGADVSMITSTQTGLGKGFNNNQGFLLSDDFIIPEDQSWTVNGFRFYAYQSGSAPLSTMFGAYLKIYSGDPDLGGYIIEDYGDENLLVSSSFTNVYREETDDFTTVSRPIMEMVCKIPDLTLESGEYWISVGGMGSMGKPDSPQNGPYMVHLQTTDGNTTTGNAVRLFQGVVIDWIDDGTQGMPFDVFGSIGDVVGIQALNQMETVKAFPNPTTGIFNVSRINGKYDVIVSNLSGKVVSSSTLNTSNNQIDLTSLPSGLYFITLVGDKTYNLKVIKE